MSRRAALALVLLMSLVISTACTTATPTPIPNMPNPASVYCEQHGGKVDLRTDAAGNVAGFCVFPDGSECDEWAYYRGECKPGGGRATPLPTAPPAPTATSVFDSAGWRIYLNEQSGYSFHYPPDAQISIGDDPLNSLSITGTGPEGWPQITISHPSGRDDYRPPEGVDLLQWLTDHNLLGENRQADLQIAGTTAIHFRHERSPQSYADDRYFFAHAGQLYMIVIGHVADKEDWEVYDRFLANFEFER